VAANQSAFTVQLGDQALGSGERPEWAEALPRDAELLARFVSSSQCVMPRL
jgi:hypothetical protein